MGGKVHIFFGTDQNKYHFVGCVPIFNVVSTSSDDILDTIECFSTLLSLATLNREMFDIFYTNPPSKWLKNFVRLRQAKLYCF